MAGEPKIARTVAEAQVGDLLWILHSEQPRYDENRKYLGRGVWGITTVLKVDRVYLTAGDLKYSRGALRYNRMTGAAQTRGGYTPSEYVKGSVDRTDSYWFGARWDIAERIKKLTDLDTLKTVAFALEMDPAPDFSVVPAEVPDHA